MLASRTCSIIPTSSFTTEVHWSGTTMVTPIPLETSPRANTVMQSCSIMQTIPNGVSLCAESSLHIRVAVLWEGRVPELDALRRRVYKYIYFMFILPSSWTNGCQVIRQPCWAGQALPRGLLEAPGGSIRLQAPWVDLAEAPRTLCSSASWAPVPRCRALPGPAAPSCLGQPWRAARGSEREQQGHRPPRWPQQRLLTRSCQVIVLIL